MNNKISFSEFYLLFHQYKRRHFSFSLQFIAPNRLIEDDSNIANIIVVNTDHTTKLNKYELRKIP